MISKESVDAFLGRKRKSYLSYKRWSRADLIEELQALGYPRRFLTKPRLHQLVCYLIGLIERKWLFFLDMGLGKTKITLDLFNAVCQLEGARQALVVVPKKVHMGSWIEQVRIHSGASIEVADVVSTAAKWELLATSQADITVIDYQGLGLAVCDRVKEDGKVKLRRNDKRMHVLRKKYRFLAFDEIHRAKNRDSLRFGILRQMVKDADHVYGLTGTPVGRDPTDLWSQCFLIDGGETLGENLGLFRQAFFTEKNGWFGGKEYKFDRSKEEQLARFLLNVSIRYSEKECLDLPPLTIKSVPIKLSREQRNVYNELRLGREIEGVRVPIDGVFHRMREITSGYIRRKVNGVPVTIPFESNPKLEAFEDLLEDIPGDCKFIVFYDYNPTGAMLSKVLSQAKLKHLVLDGTSKNTSAIERTFRDDDRIRGLLCNTASGSEGLNAQAANYVFFYECPTSPITRAQALKRAHRDGQQRHVFVFDLAAQRTVDETIIEYLEQGKDLLQALMRGKTSSLLDL